MRATLGGVRDETRKRGNGGQLRRALFVAWPFMAFGLPAAVCLGFGDLEGYFLIPASIIVIPVAGLCALIPYFLVRARGWSAVPGSVAWALALNWWCWITVVATIPGKLTGGGNASVLELLTLQTMSLAWNQRVLVTALIAGVVSWVVLLLAAATSGSPRGSTRFQKRAGFAVMIGIPIFVFIAAISGNAIEQSKTDGANEQPSAALARTIEEQVHLLSQREDTTQSDLSEVRRLIATDGWSSAYTWMFGACEREANPCYFIYASADVAQGGSSFDRSVARRELKDELLGTGWAAAKQPRYCHGRELDSFRNGDGQQLCLTYGDGSVKVALISERFWGSLFELRDAAGSGVLIFDPQARDQFAEYRWDEWQSSDLG